MVVNVKNYDDVKFMKIGQLDPYAAESRTENKAELIIKSTPDIGGSADSLVVGVLISNGSSPVVMYILFDKLSATIENFDLVYSKVDIILKSHNVKAGQIIVTLSQDILDLLLDKEKSNNDWSEYEI